MHETIPMVSLLTVSLGILIAAFAVGAIDGLVFHLRRFALFDHQGSRGEHWLHTGRAILALPTLALLYLIEPAGPVLWLAAGAVAADAVLLLLDLRAEQRSRIHLGGMPHAEYVIHVTANGLHAVGIALAFAARPAAAWASDAPSALVSPLPIAAQLAVWVLVAAAAVASIQHVHLGLRGARRGDESHVEGDRDEQIDAA